ncbi:hypothetical protein [Streptomyces sp. NPDC047985]|uniref:hypothetical protein n=1 Tax=unclassified Streptomyces TaxID=2593676 RepID=UPI00343CB2B3
MSGPEDEAVANGPDGLDEADDRSNVDGSVGLDGPAEAADPSEVDDLSREDDEDGPGDEGDADDPSEGQGWRAWGAGRFRDEGNDDGNEDGNDEGNDEGDDEGSDEGDEDGNDDRNEDRDMASTTCCEEFRTSTPHDPQSADFSLRHVDSPGVVDNSVPHTRRDSHTAPPPVTSTPPAHPPRYGRCERLPGARAATGFIRSAPGFSPVVKRI